MFLADSELYALLPLLDIVCPPDAPFVLDEQVQPASIDLRLGTVFWRPLRRFTLDLRRSRLLEIQPRRYYRRETVPFGSNIVIAPGQLLLARTLEQFTIPNGYTAELTGRSSFARLGLMVNATGGYINPGWRGHMPLQLVNFGPNAVRLMPLLPICQICIAKLTSPAQRPYGSPELQSIYINDDGGPSYWWRDKRIKELHKTLAGRLVEHAVQSEIYETIGNLEPEVIERLEADIAKLRAEDTQNASAILEAFSMKEELRRSWRRGLINTGRPLFPVAITISLWVASRVPIRWWHYVVWSCAAAALFVGLYAFRTEVGPHLGRAELLKAKASDRQ